MPTVTEIVDYVCDNTGWNAEATSTERAQIVTFVNQAYQDALEGMGNYIHTYETGASETVASGDYHYLFDTDFGFTSTDFPQRILTLSVTGNGYTDLVLEQISLGEMRRLRDSSDDASGTPIYYCLADYRNLLLYPTPSAAFTLKMDYVRIPATLAEGAGSDTELMENVQQRYHLLLLGSRAIAMCFEMDGVEEKASYWHTKADRAMEELVGGFNQRGGVVQPVQTSFLNRKLRRGSDRSQDWA